MKYLKYFAASLTGIKKGVLPVWIGMNVMIAAIAVFAGYAGAIDPEKMPFFVAGILEYKGKVIHIIDLRSVLKIETKE